MARQGTTDEDTETADGRASRSVAPGSPDPLRIHNAVVRCRVVPGRPSEVRPHVLDDALEECGFERRWDEDRFEPSQRTDVAGVYRTGENQFAFTVRGPAERRAELEALLVRSAVLADAREGGTLVEQVRVEPDPRSEMDVR